MALFNLLHISDLHFGKDSNKISVFDSRVLNDWRRIVGGSWSNVGRQHTHCSTLAQEVARTVRSESYRLDAVIISGDIATTGMYQDLLVGLQFLTAHPDPIKRHLTTLGEGTIFNPDGPEIWLVPGNHDRFQNGFGKPGSLNFETVFFNYWDKSDPVRGQILFDEESDNHLGVVFADFSLQKIGDASKPQYCSGQGFVHHDVLEKLVKKTRRIKDDHKRAAVIWVLHFPPAGTDSDYPESLMLRGHRDVIRAAMADDVAIVLAGHIHVNKIFPLDSGVSISCAGSACCYVERFFTGNWLHMVSIEVSGRSAKITQREDFKFDDQKDWRFKRV
jgi:3',5'-cyclic AMP phosphodiesterase CpdA